MAAVDIDVAGILRRTKHPVLLVANKTESPAALASVHGEFSRLGFGEPFPVSAIHGEGTGDLLDAIVDRLPPESDAEEPHAELSLALIGQPNVGKSSLLNAILGEERTIVSDIPGTTRDSIYVEFERDGRRYTLIDTAGVRRRGRVADAVEKVSVVKTLQAIEDANVVILLLDARQDISEQDAHVAGFILEAGRALAIAVNKWERLPETEREFVKRALMRNLSFLSRFGGTIPVARPARR